MQLYGHDRVSILEGGLPKWKADGGSVSSGPQPDVPVSHKPVAHAETVMVTLCVGVVVVMRI